MNEPGFGQNFARLGGWVWVALGLLFSGCTKKPDVIVYCSQDQIYAEPIFEGFTRATGLEVAAVYDSEAVKSVGLANRILAERSHPVADVFWGNEELQMRRLAATGLFRSTNGWATFGQRARRLVAGNDQRALVTLSLEQLTNAVYRGRVSMAAPWFGSTAAHFAALRVEWGSEKWLAWCRGLAANQVFLEEGNSQVVKRVERGEAWVGLTDSDDIRAAQHDGLSVVAGPDLWPIRNVVAVLNGAPHPTAAEKLFQYLQTESVRMQLYIAGALESQTGGGALTKEPPWAQMLPDFEVTTRQLQEAFQK